jgi:predicted Zn-dependent protease
MLARWAIEAWARAGDPAIEVVESDREDATILIEWVRADQGLYGETRMRVVDGRAIADVFVRPDLRGLGPDIEAAAEADSLFRDVVVYLTCVHEIGHAFGLTHTASFADIMYTFQFGGDFVGYFQRFRDQPRQALMMLRPANRASIRPPLLPWAQRPESISPRPS